MYGEGKKEYIKERHHVLLSREGIRSEFFRKEKFGTSLVAQWLRIRLPMQGTQV